MSTSCGWEGKGRYAHSDCGWTCGWAGKIVRSLENTCHTWALLRWWFTTKRRYIKCMHLYLYLYLRVSGFDFLASWLVVSEQRVSVLYLTRRRRQRRRLSGRQPWTPEQCEGPWRKTTRRNIWSRCPFLWRWWRPGAAPSTRRTFDSAPSYRRCWRRRKLRVPRLPSGTFYRDNIHQRHPHHNHRHHHRHRHHHQTSPIQRASN